MWPIAAAGLCGVALGLLWRRPRRPRVSLMDPAYRYFMRADRAGVPVPVEERLRRTVRAALEDWADVVERKF